MKVVKAVCANNHFYNCAKFEKCPICSSEISIFVNDTAGEPVIAGEKKDLVKNEAVKDYGQKETVSAESIENNEQTEILSPYFMDDEDKTVLL
jgi:hypothetical protein